MMIRKLRRNFIIVAMCSMFAVLAVIVGSLNAVSYRGTVRRADRILDMLAENDGHFPDDISGKRQPAGGKEHPAGFQDRGVFPGAFAELSPETPYDTRFFSVCLDERGGVVSVDTGRIAAVETEGAMAYAAQIWEQGRSRGFLGDYRYLRQSIEDSGDSRIIFVDCKKELDAFRGLAATSVGVSLLGIFAVFLLVLIFSRKVFGPVEESYVKQRRFITDASHELKTPLTIISANVDLLEMEGEENQWTASIRNQVKRLHGLTEQMVMLSRLEEEPGPLFTVCNLSELAGETAAVFEPLARAGEKKLTVEIEEGISCRGDEDKLRQMISLLLDNALKYASRQGEILLRLEKVKGAGKGRRARMTVWNTVDAESGIVPGRQDALFERFYRTDASRNSGTGGSGIGLSIVKTIVELHRGTISAESEDGKSICFTIILHSF